MLTNTSPSLLELVVFTLWLFSTFPYECEYLRYVNLAQFAKVLGQYLLACIGWAAFLWILSLTPLSGSEPWFPSLKFVPQYIWFVLIMAFLTKIMHRFKLVFPKLTRTQWLVVNLFIVTITAIFVISKYYLPLPALDFLAIAIWQAVERYDALIKIGKVNQEVLETLMAMAVDNSAAKSESLIEPGDFTILKVSVII